MKSSNKKAAIISCVILATAIVIAAMVVFLPKRFITPATPAQQVTVPGQHASNNGPSALLAGSTTSPKMAPIPQGSQTYQIMQAASAIPRIVQATVNPVNVHVGDTQTLILTISDPDPITSVVATIRTDNETTTVPLSLVGPAALNDVFPQKYFLNAQSQLVLANPDNGSGKGNGNVAFAAQGDEEYSAQWKVTDTHVAKYYTVFTATDAKGNVNSATINWTDTVCSWNGINNNNSTTVSINSTFGSGGCQFLSGVTDGVENGNLLIDAPVILAQGSSLIINSGYSLSFSGSGQLSIPATTPLGQIQFSDMYCASSGWVTTFANPTDGTDQVVRSSLSNNVFPGQTAYFTSSTLTNYGANTYNYNCAATVSEEYTATINATPCVAATCYGLDKNSCYSASTTPLTPGNTCGAQFVSGYTCTTNVGSDYGSCNGVSDATACNSAVSTYTTQACD